MAKKHQAVQMYNHTQKVEVPVMDLVMPSGHMQALLNQKPLVQMHNKFKAPA